MINIALILILLGVFSSDALLNQPEIEKKVIVLDPGHGGRDKGVMGKEGLCEKDVSLEVASRLKAKLEERFKDISVFLTREHDEYISLQERSGLANHKMCDLFISIHLNASSSPNACGDEVYFTSGNERLADIVQAALVKELGVTDRGIKEGPFFVLKDVLSPAVLVELGFLSNSMDEGNLRSDEYKDKIIGALSDAISEYLELETENLTCD